MRKQVLIITSIALASFLAGVVFSTVYSAFGAKPSPSPRKYDSGWLAISPGQTITLTHNLGTTEVNVYMIGKDASGFLHQYDFGYTWVGASMWGVAWHNLDGSVIQLTRAPQDQNWAQVRVMISIIS